MPPGYPRTSIVAPKIDPRVPRPKQSPSHSHNAGFFITLPSWLLSTFSPNPIRVLRMHWHGPSFTQNLPTHPLFSLSNSSISTPYSHRQSLTRPPILSHALFSLPIVAPPPARNPGSRQPIIRRFPADPRCLHSPATFHCCRLHQAGKGLKKRRDRTRSINPSPFDPSAAVGSFSILYSVLCQHSSPRHLLD